MRTPIVFPGFTSCDQADRVPEIRMRSDPAKIDRCVGVDERTGCMESRTLLNFRGEIWSSLASSRDEQFHAVQRKNLQSAANGGPIPAELEIAYRELVHAHLACFGAAQGETADDKTPDRDSGKGNETRRRARLRRPRRSPSAPGQRDSGLGGDQMARSSKCDLIRRHSRYWTPVPKPPGHSAVGRTARSRKRQQRAHGRHVDGEKRRDDGHNAAPTRTAENTSPSPLAFARK